MPYKASGKTVLILRNGRWFVLKRHASAAAAQRHARALNANVKHEG